MNITVERSLIPSPKAGNSPTIIETELLMLVLKLIRAKCSIADLSTQALAQHLDTTAMIIMDLKKSLRDKQHLEFEFVRDDNDQAGLTVRTAR